MISEGFISLLALAATVPLCQAQPQNESDSESSEEVGQADAPFCWYWPSPDVTVYTLGPDAMRVQLFSCSWLVLDPTRRRERIEVVIGWTVGPTQIATHSLIHGIQARVSYIQFPLPRSLPIPGEFFYALISRGEFYRSGTFRIEHFTG